MKNSCYHNTNLKVDMTICQPTIPNKPHLKSRNTLKLENTQDGSRGRMVS